MCQVNRVSVAYEQPRGGIDELSHSPSASTRSLQESEELSNYFMQLTLST